MAMNLRTNRIVWKEVAGRSATAASTARPAASSSLARTGPPPSVRRPQRGFLWQLDGARGGANAAPMTYAVNGKQYVAVYAGGNGILGSSAARTRARSGLYTFELPRSKREQQAGAAAVRDAGHADASRL